MTDDILCPLCSAITEEKTRAENIVKWRQCPTPFAWSTIYKQIVVTHYTREPEGLEHFYLPPFRIDSSHILGISSIFKLVKYELNNLGNKTIVINEPIELKEGVTVYIYDWQFITNTPLIKPGPADKMLEKVKLLLNFL